MTKVSDLPQKFMASSNRQHNLYQVSIIIIWWEALRILEYKNTALSMAKLGHMLYNQSMPGIRYFALIPEPRKQCTV